MASTDQLLVESRDLRAEILDLKRETSDLRSAISLLVGVEAPTTSFVRALAAALKSELSGTDVGTSNLTFDNCHMSPISVTHVP